MNQTNILLRLHGKHMLIRVNIQLQDKLAPMVLEPKTTDHGHFEQSI